MPLDLVLRQCRLAGGEHGLVDIGVAGGRIAEIAPAIVADALEEKLDGRLVTAGLVETHIHLDKSHILERCDCGKGTLAEAIAAVATAKRAFTAADIHARGRSTRDEASHQGTKRRR